MLKIVNASEVRALLPMAECIDILRVAMPAASAGDVIVPLRMIMPLHDASGHLVLMPGSVRAPATYGAKIISLHPKNPVAGRPTVQGYVTLFDPTTGAPLAIIEGSALTAIRTAAASGLATDVLARADARSHGILGTGVQAISHVDAIAAVRSGGPVVIWGRNPATARRLAAKQSARTGLTIRATSDAREAAACDIVSTVTAATEPVLRGRWLRLGCHVNLVGAHTPVAREADSDLIAAAAVYTDLRTSALNEAGDIVIPLAEGRIQRAHLRGEIGQVLSGAVHGRRADDEITVYKSLGITAQDLYAAHAVYCKAVACGAGVDVALD